MSPNRSGGIRTHPGQILSLLPLPLGYTPKKSLAPINESGRRDSNPQLPTWKDGTLPLSYSRKLPCNQGICVKQRIFRNKISDDREDIHKLFYIITCNYLFFTKIGIKIKGTRCSVYHATSQIFVLGIFKSHVGCPLN